jgi:hypothetical protein
MARRWSAESLMGRVLGLLLLTEERRDEDGILSAVLVGEISNRHATDGLSSVVDRDNRALVARIYHRGTVHLEPKAVVTERRSNDP